MPGPSFRPILAGLSMMVIVFGLVFGGAVLVAGLPDAGGDPAGLAARRPDRVQPGRRGRSDRPSPERPGAALPERNADLLRGRGHRRPPGQLRDHPAGRHAAAGRPTASGAPAASGGGRSASAPAQRPAAADVTIVAHNIAYRRRRPTPRPARRSRSPSTTRTPGIPHNVSIHTGGAGGQQVFLGKIVTGPIAEIYNVPALPAGTYTYVCSVHATMTGILTVK